MGKRGFKAGTYSHPDKVRKHIQAIALIHVLQEHALGTRNLTMSQVRAMGILLRKCIPDLLSTEVRADITHRYVALLPDVLSKDEWIKRYGDPKQLEGKNETLQ